MGEANMPEKPKKPEMVKHHMFVILDHSVPFPEPAKEVVSEPNIPESWKAVLRKYKPNWRLNMLALPKKHKITAKWVPGTEPPSPLAVSRAALQAKCTMRVAHLARTPVRYLTNNKKLFRFLGRKFRNKMDRKIASSWNSIYNYYKRSEMELRKR